jgi:hypothetical protein
MSDRHLPSELACLARQMLNTAEQLTSNAQALPGAWDAANEWATDKPMPAALTVLMHDLLIDARTLVFAAQSLGFQVGEADDRARELYGMTMEMVDGIRMGRSNHPNNPELVQLADFCEDKAAGLQERIAEQFPGETIPGG